MSRRSELVKETPRSVAPWSAFAQPAAVALLSALAAACGGRELPYDDPVANGQWLAQRECVTCHREEASVLGPSLRQLPGTEVTFLDGSTAVRDREYFERSIRDPWKQVVEGYGKTMFTLSYSDEEIEALVAWLEAGAPPEAEP